MKFSAAGIWFRLCGALLCCSSVAYASERVELPLPVFQGPAVLEVDEDGNERRTGQDRIPKGRFSGLRVSVLKTLFEDGTGIPGNVEEALAELKRMLPDDYFLFLIRRYGFVEKGEDVYSHRELSYGFDDRILDLSGFLHDVWKLDDHSRLLARQINCLGNFEFDLTPLFMLLTMEEVSQRDADMLVEMNEARVLTSILAAKCL